MKQQRSDFSQSKLNNLIENRVIRFNEVINVTGLSRPTIYRRMKANLFPNSFSLGGRSVGWYEKDIIAWLENLRRTDT